MASFVPDSLHDNPVLFLDDPTDPATQVGLTSVTVLPSSSPTSVAAFEQLGRLSNQTGASESAASLSGRVSSVRDQQWGFFGHMMGAAARLKEGAIRWGGVQALRYFPEKTAYFALGYGKASVFGWSGLFQNRDLDVQIKEIRRKADHLNRTLDGLSGGNYLVSLSKHAGQLIEETLPEYIKTDANREYLAKQTALLLVGFLGSEDENARLEKLEKSNPDGMPDNWEGLGHLQQVYNWATPWIAEKLKVAVTSDDPQDNSILKFIKCSAESTLSYVMLQLAGEVGHGENAFHIACNKLLSVYITFNNEHGKDIKAHYDQLVLEGKVPFKDKGFVKRFELLLEGVLVKAGIDSDKDISTLKNLASWGQVALRAAGPKFFAELYTNFTVPEKGPEELLKRIQTAINPDSEGVAIPEGGSVKTIESLCRVGSSQITEMLKNKTIATKNPATGELIKLDVAIPALQDEAMKGLWPQFENALSHLLMQLVANRLESTKETDAEGVSKEVISDTTTKVLKTLFLFSKVEDDKLNKVFPVAGEVLTLSQIKEAINKDKDLRDLFEKRSATFLDHFKQTGGKKTLPLLPLPGYLNNISWTYIEGSVLPSLLIDLYAANKAKQLAAEQVAKAMDKTVNSNKKYVKKTTEESSPGVNEKEPREPVHLNIRSTVCDVLASYISQMAQAFVKVDNEGLASNLFEVVRDFLKESGKPADKDAVNAFLSKEENQSQIIKQFAKVLIDTSTTLGEIRPMSKGMIKTVITQVFGGLTEKIEQRETEDTNFLLKLAMNQINLVKDHFATLNKISKSHKAAAFFKLDHDILVKGLEKEEQLHPGVPHSDEALRARKRVEHSKARIKRARINIKKMKDHGFKDRAVTRTDRALRQLFALPNHSLVELEAIVNEEKLKMIKAKKELNQERFQNFFEPFTKDFLALSGLKTADSLPFPSPLKEEIWKQLQQNLLPGVFMGIFESVLEPGSLDQMVIAALETYNTPADVNEEISEPLIEDEAQKKLNEAFGELFFQITKNIPSSMIKEAFKLNMTRKAAAATVGQSVRKQLSEKLNLQKIIDQALPSLLESFGGKLNYSQKDLYGNWTPYKSGEPIIGQKVTFEPNKTGADGGPSFDIPSTDAAIETAALKQIDEEMAREAKARVDMLSTTHKAMSDFLLAPLQTRVESFLKNWNTAVTKVFGKHEQRVRDFFNWVGTKAVYNYIKALLVLCGLPLIIVGWLAHKIFWTLMDSHLEKKVDDVMKTLHLEINENLLYKLSDHLLKSLKDGLMDQESIRSLAKQFEEGVLEEERIAQELQAAQVLQAVQEVQVLNPQEEAASTE